MLVAFGGLLPACGSDSGDDQVKVSDVWGGTTPAGQTTGAIYATLESSSDNKLTGASVPGDFASKTELHETGEAEGADMSGESDMSGDSDMSGESTGTTDKDGMDDKGHTEDKAGMEGHSGSAMMAMTPVSSIDLPAGEEVNLEPGGYHIMMFDLAEPIKSGESIPVTLSFESGDDMKIDATAREG